MMTQRSDERLREAYRARASATSAAARAGCPDPRALLALLERSGAERERLAVLDHVMACAPCTSELDLVRAARAAAVAAGGAAPVRSWMRAPSMGLVAIAATLLLVAGVSLYDTMRDPESGRRLRGGTGAAAHSPRWLSDGVVLSWRPVPGAVSYRVEVLDAAGRAVVDSILADTAMVVADALARASRPLVWTVAATLADGSTRASVPAMIPAPPASR